MADDYYRVLGVARNADEKEVRAAFRKMARKYHPDVNPGDPAAEECFKKINEANEVLSSPESRRLYDRYGANWRQAQRGGGGAPFGGASQGGGDPFADIFSGGGGGRTVFDAFFGGGRGPRQRANRRPAPLEQQAEITLEEAFHGATRSLQVTGQSPCDVCTGHGYVVGAGAGVASPCPACHGQGFSFQPVRGEVSIPPGVRDGSRVRVAPGGHQVVLIIAVLPHPVFQRKGDDLSSEVTVPLYDAVLGAEAVVPTLTGQVALSLPPETQNGRVFRLGRQGMPKLGAPGERGSLYVTIRTELPTTLSDEERRLFGQLKDLRQDGRRP